MITPTEFVLFAFAAFGLSYVLGHSTLSYPFRDSVYNFAMRKTTQGLGGVALIRWIALWFIKLIECPACLSFWIGFAFARYDGASWINAFGFGLSLCGTSLTLALTSGLIAREK